MTNASGTRYYLMYDQVGSLRLVTDASGTTIKQVDYDSFGGVIGTSGTNPSLDVPFGFAGGLYDPATKLVRFGYRDYDPDTGRWTAKDPILFSGGDTNLYGYCLNDPVDLIDPEGLWGIGGFGGGSLEGGMGGLGGGITGSGGVGFFGGGSQGGNWGGMEVLDHS